MRLPVNFIYLSLRAARPGVRLVLFFGGLLGLAGAGYYFHLGFGQIAFKHFLLGLSSLGGIPAYEAMLMLLDPEDRE